MQDRTEIIKLGAHTAGMFEIGGHVGLQIIRRDIERDEVVPLLRIRDTHINKLLRIQEKLGGKTHPPIGNSYLWEARKEEALLVTRSTKPYALYRLPYIDAIESWSTTTDLQALIDKTRELQAYNIAPKMPTVEEYLEALKSDLFLAGCFANRGQPYPHETLKQMISVNIQIHSANKPLLEAIRITLRVPEAEGHLESVYEPGDISRFHGEPIVLRKGSYRLRLGVLQSHALLERIQDADYVNSAFIKNTLSRYSYHGAATV